MIEESTGKKNVDVFNAEKIDRGRRMSEVFPVAWAKV
jgi:hypothetical protein